MMGLRADGEIGRRTTLKMWRPLVMRVRVSLCPFDFFSLSRVGVLYGALLHGINRCPSTGLYLHLWEV